MQRPVALVNYLAKPNGGNFDETALEKKFL